MIDIMIKLDFFVKLTTLVRVESYRASARGEIFGRRRWKIPTNRTPTQKILLTVDSWFKQSSENILLFPSKSQNESR